MNKEECGPIYNVPLIKSLPVHNHGMIQAMPSRNDLMMVKSINARVVAGYEVAIATIEIQNQKIHNLEKTIEQFDLWIDKIISTNPAHRNAVILNMIDYRNEQRKNKKND